ncbi:MAG: hypothetical protein IKL27_08070, partial [Oscillospiraceae bacterium]|nr:hypothetical protein [Oscillospiraceae bacterium]
GRGVPLPICSITGKRSYFNDSKSMIYLQKRPRNAPLTKRNGGMVVKTGGVSYYAVERRRCL